MGVIVQVCQKDIVGDDGPLLVIQGRETFQIRQQVIIEVVIILGEVTHDLGSAGDGELKVYLVGNRETLCFCDVFLDNDKFTIFEDHIDQLPVIVDTDIH